MNEFSPEKYFKKVNKTLKTFRYKKHTHCV